MKRAETLWQVGVLLLVLAMAVGIYILLALAWQRLGEREGVVASALIGQAGDGQAGSTVQIVAPLDGAVLQASAPLTVRATAHEPGFSRTELELDERKVAVEINSDLQAVPWIMEWTLAGLDEGRHELVVWAWRSQGGWERSVPVMVAAVPSGHLFFASNRHGSYAVFTMQTDGSGLARLTAGPGDAHQPAVRGDGVLAYVAETGSGQTMIRQMEMGGDGASDLWIGRDPTWSPEGGRLAYAASVNGVSQVFVAQATQGTPSRLTREEAYAGQPAWSPDGTQVVYAAEQDGNWDLWTMAVTGGEPHRLTDDPAMDWAPAWSPDGSRLAFVSNRGGSHQIYLMRADGTDVQALTDLTQGAESPTWSPDGFWLAFVAYTGFGTGINARELYLMRADGQEQVRLTRNAYDDAEPDWAGLP